MAGLRDQYDALTKKLEGTHRKIVEPNPPARLRWEAIEDDKAGLDLPFVVVINDARAEEDLVH